MPTGIEWTQEVWNPFIGCDKVSPGCEHCYAITMANRLAHIPATKHIYGDSVKKTTGGKVNWSGKIIENTPQGDKPLRFKKPTTFFVNSMSDLFHKDVTFQMIDSVYDVMDACPQHIFQILSKRAERMLEYYKWKEAGNGLKFQNWPLHNVWLGVSAENQKYLDERLEYLLQCKAATRFLSCEPLLGEIEIPFIGTAPKDWGYGYVNIAHLLGWVIVGGESGPGARLMEAKWARSIIRQCEDAQIPVYFKQWGAYDESENKVGKSKSGNTILGKQFLQFPNQ